MDYLPSKRASLKAGQFKRVVVLPSMTVMHVPQSPSGIMMFFDRAFAA